MNYKFLIPLRSGFIIFLALVAEELIRFREWMSVWMALPYAVGVSLAFIAIEYARIYKVKLPSKQTKGFMPLVWG